MTTTTHAVTAVALLALAACSTTGSPSPEERDPHEHFLLIEFPLARNARTEEEGEKEVRTQIAHDKHATTFVGEVEYGVTDQLQLSVEAPITRFHGIGAPDDGVQHVEFGAFYAPTQDIDQLAFGLGANVTAPVEETDTDYELFAVAGRRIREFEVHGAIGVAWNSDDTNVLWSLSGTAEVGWDQLHPTLELFGEGSQTWLGPGLVWQPRHNMEAAVGVPLGVGGDTESIGVQFSFLIEW